MELVFHLRINPIIRCVADQARELAGRRIALGEAPLGPHAYEWAPLHWMEGRGGGSVP